MNTLVLLIVTMGSSFGLSYNGYGGVSVTTMPNMNTCYNAKKVVEEQIRDTDNLYFDGKEIIVTCQKVNHTEE